MKSKWSNRTMEVPWAPVSASAQPNQLLSNLLPQTFSLCLPCQQMLRLSKFYPVRQHKLRAAMSEHPRPPPAESASLVYTSRSSITNESIERPTYHLTQSSTVESFLMPAQVRKLFPQSCTLFFYPSTASENIGTVPFHIHHDHQARHGARTALQCNAVVSCYHCRSPPNPFTHPKVRQSPIPFCRLTIVT